MIKNKEQKTWFFNNLYSCFPESELHLKLDTVCQLTRIMMNIEFDFVLWDNAGGTLFEILINTSKHPDRVTTFVKHEELFKYIKAYQIGDTFVPLYFPFRSRNSDHIYWE